MDRTHDARPVFGAVPGTDSAAGRPVLAAAHRSTHAARSGAKPSSSSTSTRRLNGVVGARDGPAAERSSESTFAPRPVPRPAPWRSGSASAAKPHGEYLGEQAVVPRPAAVHLPDRAEHQRWTARPLAVRLDLLHLPVADQAVEVEAHGVGMHAQHVGDPDDAHRSRRRAQYPHHTTTAAGLSSACPKVAHAPSASSPVGCAATRGASTPSGTDLRGPARGPQWLVATRQGFCEECFIVGQVRL